jgi:hypothetical protein
VKVISNDYTRQFKLGNPALWSLEPFLSTLQNMGVKFLQGVENFQQGEVLFLQAAYNFLHAAKVHFMQLYLELF